MDGVKLNWNVPLINGFKDRSFLTHSYYQQCSIYNEYFPDPEQPRDDAVGKNSLPPTLQTAALTSSMAEATSNKSNSSVKEKHAAENSSQESVKKSQSMKTESKAAWSKPSVKKLTTQTAPRPRVPYPRLSSLTHSEQRRYLELCDKYSERPALGPEELKEMNVLRELNGKVMIEQEQYMIYLEQAARNHPEFYEHISDEAYEFTEAYLNKHRQRALRYPRYYVQYDTISLVPDKQQQNYMTLERLCTLLELGIVPQLVLPNPRMNPKSKLTEYNKVMSRYGLDEPSLNEQESHKKVVSEDCVSEKLALKYEVDFVLTATVLYHLLDNQPPHYNLQWELPVTVREHSVKSDMGVETKRTVICLDKPFVPRTVSKVDRSALYHKCALKTSLLQLNQENSHRLDNAIVNLSPKSQCKNGHGEIEMSFGRIDDSADSSCDETDKDENDNSEIFGSCSEDIAKLETFGTSSRSFTQKKVNISSANTTEGETFSTAETVSQDNLITPSTISDIESIAQDINSHLTSSTVGEPCELPNIEMPVLSPIVSFNRPESDICVPNQSVPVWQEIMPSQSVRRSKRLSTRRISYDSDALTGTDSEAEGALLIDTSGDEALPSPARPQRGMAVSQCSSGSVSPRGVKTVGMQTAEVKSELLKLNSVTENLNLNSETEQSTMNSETENLKLKSEIKEEQDCSKSKAGMQCSQNEKENVSMSQNARNGQGSLSKAGVQLCKQELEDFSKVVPLISDATVAQKGTNESQELGVGGSTASPYRRTTRSVSGRRGAADIKENTTRSHNSSQKSVADSTEELLSPASRKSRNFSTRASESSQRSTADSTEEIFSPARKLRNRSSRASESSQNSSICVQNTTDLASGLSALENCREDQDITMEVEIDMEKQGESEKGSSKMESLARETRQTRSKAKTESTSVEINERKVNESAAASTTPANTNTVNAAVAASTVATTETTSSQLFRRFYGDKQQRLSVTDHVERKGSQNPGNLQGSHEVKGMLENASDYTQPSTGNVGYYLWCLGEEFKLLVRQKYHGSQVSNCRRQLTQVVSKLEHQSDHGVEDTTCSERLKSWLALHLRPNSRIIRGRIDALTSEVIMTEFLDSATVNTKFNPSYCLNSLQRILKKLKSLRPGQYLLGHNPGCAHLQIKKTTLSERGVYDLHLAYSSTAESVSGSNTHWLPIDTSVRLPIHNKLFRVPCTFEPKDSAQASFNTAHQNHKDNKCGKKKKKSKRRI